MRRIIKLTFLVDISSSIMMLIIYTILDSLIIGLYAGVMIFGNILLPTLCGVLIYFGIKRGTTINDSPIKTVLIQVVLLAALFIAVLLAWAVAEAAISKNFNWEKIREVYNSEFAGFLPVVFAEAILIPIFDQLLPDRQPTPTSDL